MVEKIVGISTLQGNAGQLGRRSQPQGKAWPERCSVVDVKLHGPDLVEAGDDAVIGSGNDLVEPLDHAAMGMARQLDVDPGFGIGGDADRRGRGC